MPKNPLGNRTFSQPKATKKDVLTLEMVNAILVVATATRFPVLAMLAFGGMRSGECRNLRSDDVDLVNKWIYIRSRAGFETKTGTEWKVPIHARLLKILSSLPARHGGWYFTALPSNRYPGGGPHVIYPSNIATRFDMTTIANILLVTLIPVMRSPQGKVGNRDIPSLRKQQRLTSACCFCTCEP